LYEQRSLIDMLYEQRSLIDMLCEHICGKL